MMKKVLLIGLVMGWPTLGIAQDQDTVTLEEARELVEADPAVQAGRLVEVHPWWTAKGSQLK